MNTSLQSRIRGCARLAHDYAISRRIAMNNAG